MMDPGRARALRYVAELVTRYESNLRGARRAGHRAADWLETCVERLRKELGVMQGDSPEGRALVGRWAFLTEGL